MRTVTIDGSRFETVREIHAFLAAELGFPAYYGHNLDALHDVLTEGGYEDVTFVLEQTQCHPRFFAGLARVLEDAGMAYVREQKRGI